MTDAPQAIRLTMLGPIDRLDIAAAETATQVALSDGRDVVLDLTKVGPTSVHLLRALARIAGTVHDPGRVVLKGVDRITVQFLEARGLEHWVVLEPAV